MAEQMTDDQIRVAIMQINTPAIMNKRRLRDVAADSLDFLAMLKKPTPNDLEFKATCQALMACKCSQCKEQKNLAGEQTDAAQNERPLNQKGIPDNMPPAAANGKPACTNCGCPPGARRDAPSARALSCHCNCHDKHQRVAVYLCKIPA